MGNQIVNWKVAVIILIILFVVISFAGGYVVKQYLDLKDIKLELEAENIAMRKEIEAKELVIEEYTASNKLIQAEIEVVQAINQRLYQTIDSLEDAQLKYIEQVATYTDSQHVEMFNRFTGYGTKAALVEYASDTLMMTPMPRVKRANNTFVREQFLGEQIVLRDSIIINQLTQINKLETINSSQGLIINEQGEIILLQDRQLRNKDAIIDELSSIYAIRRWRSTAVGGAVGFILGKIF